MVEFCVSGFGRQGCNLSPRTSPCVPLSPSSQPLQRLTFRTSVIPGTQVGPYAPAWGDAEAPSLSPSPVYLTVPFHFSIFAYLCACISPAELSRKDWVWWPMPVTLAFGKLRQEDYRFKGSLITTRTTKRNPFSKTGKATKYQNKTTRKGCRSGSTKLWVPSPAPHKSGMVFVGLSSQHLEGAGKRMEEFHLTTKGIPGHMGYMRPCLQRKAGCCMSVIPALGRTEAGLRV